MELNYIKREFRELLEIQKRMSTTVAASLDRDQGNILTESQGNIFKATMPDEADIRVKPTSP